jgi:hypothetical protein
MVFRHAQGTAPGLNILRLPVDAAYIYLAG